MYISLDFFDKFICTGKTCGASCCTGWQISIDEKTYQNYQNIKGRFGQFVRRNLYEKDERHLIRMDENRSCPFLNEDDLCQLYIRYGENYMGETCTNFPRRFLNCGRIRLQAVSCSCEEVLRILYNKPEAVKLQQKGTPVEAVEEEQSIQNLCHFLSRGMDFLQDSSIPFGKALATLLYLSTDNTIWGLDNEQINACLAQTPDVLAEFTLTEQSMTRKELEQAAWQLIFVVTDTFCQIIKETDSFLTEQFLWADTFFQLSDEERKQQLYDRWKNHPKDSNHLTFMRKAAATLFFSDGMALSVQSAESIFIQKIANFIILAEVLPPAWNPEYQNNLEQYFTGLSLLCRKFDQSNVVKKFVYPVICDLIEPDILTYAIAFMVLFDEQ